MIKWTFGQVRKLEYLILKFRRQASCGETGLNVLVTGNW